jgi:hypothetical protein
MLLIQGHEYIILDPIWPFLYTILIYNMWANEADVVDPFFLAFFQLHPTRFKIKKGRERNLVELEYKNEMKHLHSKYTDEGLVKGILIVEKPKNNKFNPYVIHPLMEMPILNSSCEHYIPL